MLTEKVRQRNFLYDTKSPDYRDQHMRANAWEGIGKELKIKRKFYVNSRDVRTVCSQLNARRNDDSRSRSMLSYPKPCGQSQAQAKARRLTYEHDRVRDYAGDGFQPRATAISLRDLRFSNYLLPLPGMTNTEIPCLWATLLHCRLSGCNAILFNMHFVH
jgi:hypothetical protein